MNMAATVVPSLQPAPRDTVQAVRFTRESQRPLLATADWDGCVQIWHCLSPTTATLRGETHQSFPVFAVAWNCENSHLFLGDAEGKVKAWELHTNAGFCLGERSTPIRALEFCGETRTLISGSWDQTICFWDERQRGPSLEIHTKGRIFGLAQVYPILAAIQSDKNVTIWDMRVLQEGKMEGITVSDTQFKYQMRSVAISHDAKSLALGLIDGRIFIKKITQRVLTHIESDYSFKCHRDNNYSYGVNALCFNPLHATVLHSGGSDEAVTTWDMAARQKVKGYTDLGAPVTALDVSADSSTLAYAIGGDWHNGPEALPCGLVLRDISTECIRPSSYIA